MGAMKVDFTPKSYEAEMIVPRPKPAASYLPNWYKNTDFFEGGTPMVSQNGVSNATVKACAPFYDAMSMGYIQESWCDLLVQFSESGYVSIIESLASYGPQTVTTRDKITYKIPDDYHQADFSWQLQWIPSLPSGYSMMYIQPFNRWDMPFNNVAGIIDNDTYTYENAGNCPFMVKKDFTGIIPKGTPLFQMIPFKRDNWISSFSDHDPKNQIRANLVNTKFWGAYRKMFWQKKSFK